MKVKEKFIWTVLLLALAFARKAKAAGVAFSVAGLAGGVRETFLHSGFGSLVTLDD